MQRFDATVRIFGQTTMRRLLCILILALISSEASAQWQSIGESDAETAYVDIAGIKRYPNGLTAMSALFDLKQPRAIGDMDYLSVKIEREYACRSRRSRIIAKAAYAGHMAQGEIIYTSNVREKWAIIAKDSAEEALWNIACGK